MLVGGMLVLGMGGGDVVVFVCVGVGLELVVGVDVGVVVTVVGGQWVDVRAMVLDQVGDVGVVVKLFVEPSFTLNRAQLDYIVGSFCEALDVVGVLGEADEVLGAQGSETAAEAHAPVLGWELG